MSRRTDLHIRYTDGAFWIFDGDEPYEEMEPEDEMSEAEKAAAEQARLPGFRSGIQTGG